MSEYPPEYLNYLGVFHIAFGKIRAAYNQAIEEDPNPDYIPLLDMAPEHRQELMQNLLGKLVEHLDDEDDAKVYAVVAEAFSYGLITGHAVNMAREIITEDGSGVEPPAHIRPLPRNRRRSRNR